MSLHSLLSQTISKFFVTTTLNPSLKYRGLNIEFQICAILNGEWHYICAWNANYWQNDKAKSKQLKFIRGPTFCTIIMVCTEFPAVLLIGECQSGFDTREQQLVCTCHAPVVLIRWSFCEQILSFILSPGDHEIDTIYGRHQEGVKV